MLNQRKSTTVIISHDRHFLNAVCTHIADIDYGELLVYPGNYDDFMLASTQARELLQSENVKKSAQIANLQQFVSRFPANASKAKQATSQARQLEKIELHEIKPSSRGYEDEDLFHKGNLILEAGSRLAIISENGTGKSTLLRCLMNEISPNEGIVKWTENATQGYCPQDTTPEFNCELNLFDWMSQWRKPRHDDQIVRASLERMLFSTEDFKKKVKVCSGGEKNRLLFGKLILMETNVLVMDEPTNHLDMEAIEALNLALENYEGTLIFVSHDREFVSSLATHIIETWSLDSNATVH